MAATGGGTRPSQQAQTRPRVYRASQRPSRMAICTIPLYFSDGTQWAIKLPSWCSRPLLLGASRWFAWWLQVGSCRYKAITASAKQAGFSTVSQGPGLLPYFMTISSLAPHLFDQMPCKIVSCECMPQVENWENRPSQPARTRPRAYKAQRPYLIPWPSLMKCIRQVKLSCSTFGCKQRVRVVATGGELGVQGHHCQRKPGPGPAEPHGGAVPADLSRCWALRRRQVLPDQRPQPPQPSPVWHWPLACACRLSGIARGCYFHSSASSCLTGVTGSSSAGQPCKCGSAWGVRVPSHTEP